MKYFNNTSLQQYLTFIKIYLDLLHIGPYQIPQTREAEIYVIQLVAVDGEPRIKLSEQVDKITMPGKKKAFRLYGKDGKI